MVKDLQEKARCDYTRNSRRPVAGDHFVLTIVSSCVVCMQWDRVENKTSVVLYGAGGIVLIWFSSTLVTALNSIPLVGWGG